MQYRKNDVGVAVAEQILWMAAGVSSAFLRSMSDRWDWPIPLRLDSSFWVSTRRLRKSTTRRPRLNWTHLPSITRGADITLVDVEFVEGLHVAGCVTNDISISFDSFTAIT